MKVKELITLLQTFDPELPVLTAVPEMDYDAVISANIVRVIDSGRRLHMCGKYQDMDRNYLSDQAENIGQPFDALILDAE